MEKNKSQNISASDVASLIDKTKNYIIHINMNHPFIIENFSVGILECRPITSLFALENCSKTAHIHR